GVPASDWSWGALMFDMDNDGYNDIYVCNGVNRDVTDLDFIDFFANDVIQKMVLTGKKDNVDQVLLKIPQNPLPNKAFHNQHDLRFIDKAKQWGLVQSSFSNGAAYGELDNDGDLDLVVNNENMEAFVYKNLIALLNRTKEAWSYIEFQLKRRYDLIPNLVNSVKGYATHESTAFEKVTQARAEAMQAKTMSEHAKSEALLGGAISGIFGIAEAYPDLKANTNFLELQRELADTENKIQAARRFYNTNVRDMNTTIEQFPTNSIAGMFGFKGAEFFDLPDGDVAQQNVEVKF
ncbi:MAG: LemA family protein, partial [Candidatus Paceibacteria bacterium]